jgi:putative ABC transport system ATP-binding protein
MMSQIEFKRVTKTYVRGGERLVVLDAMDFAVPAADFVALMGPSGSGKSTILNLAGGLDRPDDGEVWVAGTRVDELGGAELAAWRARNVGFVFQAFNLVPVLSAIENVMLPLNLQPLTRAQRRAQAEYALEIVGLKDRMKHRPRQLSGGQEQRVAIARALATDPAILLADEPTGDLDRASADAVMDLLRRLNAEMNKTILMVTHDLAAAAKARRTLQLDKGALIERVGAR